MHAIVVCISLCVLSTQAVADNPLRMNNPNQAAVVNGHGGQFMLRLVSNPTTGFSWFWVNDGSLSGVTPTAHRYIPPSTKLVGAPGMEEWTFKIDTKWRGVPQVLHVKMQYLRPWSKEAKAPLVFTIVYNPLDAGASHP